MSQDNIIALTGREEISDPLTELLRSGARQLICQAVEAEFEEFMAGYAGQKTSRGHAAVVRNGHQPEREIQTGIGPVKVRVPKVRSKTGHAVVDEPGRLVKATITGAQVHDSKEMPVLLEGHEANPKAVVADKTYGSKDIRQRIADMGALAVIPSKSNARIHIPHDAALYAMRNVVERFFCTMKDMRGLATRYEKLSRNFLAMVHLFAIRCWCN